MFWQKTRTQKARTTRSTTSGPDARRTFGLGRAGRAFPPPALWNIQRLKPHPAPHGEPEQIRNSCSHRVRALTVWKRTRNP